MESSSIKMSMNEDPKVLFFQYGGAHGEMHKDGVYSVYQAFGVTKRQEALWAQELEGKLLKKIRYTAYVDEDFHKLTGVIKRYDSVHGLVSLIDALDDKERGFDTFTRLLAAELIVDVWEYFKGLRIIGSNDEVVVARYMQRALSRLQSEPIYTIASIYKNGSFLPEAFTDEALKKRIRRLIGKVS